MTEEQAKNCADLLQAIAEENRLRIIRCLSDGPKNVTELHKMLNEPIVNVSHHLGVLKSNRLVKAEKQGRFVVYSLSPDYFRVGGSKGTQLDLGHCSVLFPLD
jgi:ArsR family transcriptional regulator, nickel/cobalt-responsive transcriptional repressor